MAHGFLTKLLIFLLSKNFSFRVNKKPNEQFFFFEKCSRIFLKDFYIVVNMILVSFCGVAKKSATRGGTLLVGLFGGGLN